MSGIIDKISDVALDKSVSTIILNQEEWEELQHEVRYYEYFLSKLVSRYGNLYYKDVSIRKKNVK